MLIQDTASNTGIMSTLDCGTETWTFKNHKWSFNFKLKKKAYATFLLFIFEYVRFFQHVFPIISFSH